MKKILLISTFLFLLAACSSTVSDPGEMPTDLDQLLQMQREKRDQLNILQQELHDIESAIYKIDPTLGESRKLLVTTMPVVRKDFERFVGIQGRVESNDVVHVSSEVAGRLTQVNVREGQYVRRGQLVAKVDMETLKKQISEVETSLELAKDLYNRQKRLWDQQIGSEVQYLQAKNNKERLEKSLETLQSQLSKENIHAPISGELHKLHLEAGETAMPGAPIAEIINTRNLKVVIDAPESYLGKVRRGQYVTVRFPSLDMEQQAYVSRISSTIDEANRTFSVEANIRNPEGLFKPNLLSEMLVNDYQAKDVVVIPVNLLQQEVGGKYFVFVVDEHDGQYTARKKYVSIGESYDGEIIITEGLSGEEELIDKGSKSLSDGEQIDISNETISANG